MDMAERTYLCSTRESHVHDPSDRYSRLDIQDFFTPTLFHHLSPGLSLFHQTLYIVRYLNLIIGRLGRIGYLGSSGSFHLRSDRLE
jgi:hypothetical protein